MTEDVPELPVRTKPVKVSFWKSNKYYIILFLMFIAFISSYVFGFIETTKGKLFMGLLVILIVWLVIELFFGKRTRFNISVERAKDPNYYIRYIMDYYNSSKLPKFNFTLNPTGNVMFMPSLQPTLMIAEFSDKVTNKIYVVIVRLADIPVIRGFLPCTFDYFMKAYLPRLKILGIAERSGELATYVKNGRRMQIPIELATLLDDMEGGPLQ